jgi:wyosine [tRNA(Phe)-imidazoG37] synthetase (radical SAM superfamily)
VYCEFGRAPSAGSAPRWPDPQEVASALAGALTRGIRLDAVTISGHGEPTLHPRFAAVASAVLSEVRRARPALPVRILTNGTGAVRADVRRALDGLDERIVKLDAAAERVNRPRRSYPLGAVIQALSLLRDVTLQSCFIEGAISNTDPATVRDWIELVSEISPAAVQIYTIDRAPATAGIRPVSAERLEVIARRLRQHTRAEVHSFPEAAGRGRRAGTGPWWRKGLEAGPGH